MKLDLHRVVELFRKSFSTSLSDAEKEELDETLQDGCLKEVYDQLSDETFVLDKFREFEIWASLKFTGPSFGIGTKDGKDRMYCDRIFLIDTTK